MSEWVKKLFGTEKPVIAMAHLPALPGTPSYNMDKGVSYIVDHVIQDVALLESGGVDAVMFCNEDDRPYVFRAEIEQIAAFARVVAEAKPTKIPFGVDFLWDPMAAIAIATATDASFIREVMTGVYESDMGLWTPDAGKVMRYRHQIGGKNVRSFFNIVPEFASPLGNRSMFDRARSVVVSSLADVILVSGPMAGMEPNLDVILDIKKAVGDTPVFLNTGAKVENINTYLQVVDGVIVGSGLKKDGYTWNPVDPYRVTRFMEQVQLARSSITLVSEAV